MRRSPFGGGEGDPRFIVCMHTNTGYRLYLHGLQYSCRSQTVMQTEKTCCFLSPFSLSKNHGVFARLMHRLHRQNNIRRCDPPSQINLPLLQPAEPRSRGDLCLSWQQWISGVGCPQTSCISTMHFARTQPISDAANAMQCKSLASNKY